MRVAELASELGNRKAAALAYQQVAQLAAAEGGDAAQWYERAYQEDASDQGIALAYGKSLLAQGQVGAAIFILEPQMNSGRGHAGVARDLCRCAGGGGPLCRGRTAGVAAV